MTSDDSAYTDRFTAAVGASLLSCGIDIKKIGCEHKSIGVAVSGGADSTALLVSLAELCRQNNVFLHVITVNHNIRPEAETAGDAVFVQRLCEILTGEGYFVDCTITEIPRGKVEQTEKERKAGIEEAARFLRYEAFVAFAEKLNVCCICLAHNRNDQLETLLMRFLQGSGGEAVSGIRQTRGIFVRPLLGVFRKDIEKYLKLLHVSWRTDATNSDTRYLRNRIRCHLIPMLNELYPGWQFAVLSGARKAADAEEVVNSLASRCTWDIAKNSERKTAGVSMALVDFSRELHGVRVHLLYDAFTLCGIQNRIPYSFVENAADGKSGNVAGVSVLYTEKKVFVKKTEKRATDFGFSIIIESAGVYEIPAGTMTVVPSSDNSCRYILSIETKRDTILQMDGFLLPLCVRSREYGDTIEAADGSYRTVADILASWKVASEQRDMIPIIQDLSSPLQKIIVLWGSICGYDDWIVKKKD